MLDAQIICALMDQVLRAENIQVFLSQGYLALRFHPTFSHNTWRKYSFLLIGFLGGTVYSDWYSKMHKVHHRWTYHVHVWGKKLCIKPCRLHPPSHHWGSENWIFWVVNFICHPVRQLLLPKLSLFAIFIRWMQDVSYSYSSILNIFHVSCEVCDT